MAGTGRRRTCRIPKEGRVKYSTAVGAPNGFRSISVGLQVHGRNWKLPTYVGAPNWFRSIDFCGLNKWMARSPDLAMGV